jgi:predicted transposase/invertase (TIGR01784 family)
VSLLQTGVLQETLFSKLILSRSVKQDEYDVHYLFMQKTRPLLSPKNDFVFKLIFGDPKNSDILIDFLSGVLELPQDEFDQVYLVDPHLRKEDENDKLSVLDVKVKTKTGAVIDIEIQVNVHKWLRERIIYYLSKMVTEQIGEGESYEKIKKTVIILVLDFIFIKDSPYCHNRYQLRTGDGRSVFSDTVEIDTLELPKARQNDGGKVDTKLADWLRFFNAESEEELMVAAERNPKIGRARAILVRLSEDERARLLAESREKGRRDWDACLKTAIITGLEEGRAKGLEEGREEGRAKGLEEGRAKGLEEGREEGQTAVLALMKEGLSLAEIEARLGLR